MNKQDKEYQDACLDELRPLVGKRITNLIKDDQGFFGFQTEDKVDVWINRDGKATVRVSLT